MRTLLAFVLAAFLLVPAFVPAAHAAAPTFSSSGATAVDQTAPAKMTKKEKKAQKEAEAKKKADAKTETTTAAPATTATTTAAPVAGTDTKAAKPAKKAPGSPKTCNPAKSKACGNACIPLSRTCHKE